MLEFMINQTTCTKCGHCAEDCPARIIDMDNGFPGIAPDKESICYRCQHCLAVCPTGSVSIFGLKPEDSQLLAGNFPDSNQLEIMLKGRRAVRRYKEENLEPELLQRLLDASCHAPSGMNMRQVRFTVVDDRKKLLQLRDEMMVELCRMLHDGSFPGGMEYFANFVKMWEEEQIDFLFRGAPHLLVASAPKNVVTPVQDCLIALSYFELFANSLGIGTLWNGLAKAAINDILPKYRSRLGIPEDHVIGYAMAFGRPAVKYARTAQHGPARIFRVA
jgi:nitroreductase/NAD-dependent dihydropyrimidine dehydrogenase PreA subunit